MKKPCKKHDEKYWVEPFPEGIGHKGMGYCKKGGWHFSYFGDVNSIKNKIENFLHQEYNNSNVLDNIEKNINLGKDILLRDNFQIDYLDKLDDYLPRNYKMLLR